MSTQVRRSSFSSSTSSSFSKRNAPSASSSDNAGKVKAKKRAQLSNLTNLKHDSARSSVPSSTTSKMSTHLRSSFSSSTSSSLPKRYAASATSSDSAGVVTAKKRAPLSNLTNHVSSRSSVPSSTMVPCATKIAKPKTGLPASTSHLENNFPAILNLKSNSDAPSKIKTIPRSDTTILNAVPMPALVSMDISPSKSEENSVSLDETMSTCDSLKSPDVEYIDNNDIPPIDSIDRKTFSNLYISDDAKTSGLFLKTNDGNVCNRDILVKMEIDDEVVNVDNDYMDPQLCATIACDIYKHLRASESKKRPAADFLERIQKDVNASMRAILIDWLVEVAEEYRLVPDTLYLTINYIDRYLSGNPMNRQRLQLLGVACMMIASKYEEICAPQVEEFCYITDNTYFKEEVLQMESAVLNYLKFEMTAPTAKCFLRRFVRAAQGINEVPLMQLECQTNYVAELSLLEYNMLCYTPSLIAASAIFLAKFILTPTKRPWNSTLQHYTLYQPSDLSDCVKDLHRLCCNAPSSNLPAIREKYSQHKYKHVATKHCPPLIPAEFFNNQSH